MWKLNRETSDPTHQFVEYRQYKEGDSPYADEVSVQTPSMKPVRKRNHPNDTFTSVIN